MHAARNEDSTNSKRHRGRPINSAPSVVSRYSIGWHAERARAAQSALSGAPTPRLASWLPRPMDHFCAAAGVSWLQRGGLRLGLQAIVGSNARQWLAAGGGALWRASCLTMRIPSSSSFRNLRPAYGGARVRVDRSLPLLSGRSLQHAALVSAAGAVCDTATSE